jgi:hypothetical protein
MLTVTLSFHLRSSPNPLRDYGSVYCPGFLERRYPTMGNPSGLHREFESSLVFACNGN